MINLHKETRNLYAENYKMLVKEIKDDTNRWRDTQCSQIETINVVKITTLSKEIYRFKFNPYQITNGIFTKLEQNVLQFVWKHKRS